MAGRGPRRRTAQVIALALAGLASLCAHAQAPQLALPLACTPGRDCWIANYVDGDPGPGVRDYACGRMSYNRHEGTDFALRDLKAMAEGVAVLAAAPGVVGGVRDGEPDRSIRELGASVPEGRECGNGVRIEHEGGWSTQYCHMRNGSVTVKPGERVQAGARLGLVGLSGRTEFPHLHLGVRQGKRTVDPFVGPAPAAGCGPGATQLWNEATRASLGYARGAVYNYGVAPEAPQAEAARRGDYRARTLPAAAPRLALWAEMFGTAPGDKLVFEVTAPDGRRIIENKMAIERAQARIYRYLAPPRPGAAWPAGTYRAKIEAFSEGDPPRSLSKAEFDFEIR